MYSVNARRSKEWIAKQTNVDHWTVYSGWVYNETVFIPNITAKIVQSGNVSFVYMNQECKFCIYFVNE